MEEQKTYAQGVQDGRRMERIELTVRYLRQLSRSLKIPPEEIMAMLMLPKSEWKTYRKILENRQRQIDGKTEKTK